MSNSSMANYRESAVTGDWFAGSPAILAYTNGNQVNGWEQPLFPKSSAKQIAELMPEVVIFDVHGRQVKTQHDAGFAVLSPAERIEIGGEEVEVYSIGGGWCWKAAEQSGNRVGA